MGEGGSSATLVAHVTDVDWNIDSVMIDLTPIGGNIIEMNDRGLDGDESVGDDLFSTIITVPGLELGVITLNITATDKFDVESKGSGDIEVINQAPRLISVEILPNTGPRGTIMIVNAQAYDGHGVNSVSIDLRNSGGELVNLIESSGIWAGQITVPEEMSPGLQNVNFILEDNIGKIAVTNLWYQDQPDNQHSRGPHFISDEVTVPIQISILNSPPTMEVPSDLKLERPETSSTEVIEIRIIDSDGILNARADLGVFAPLGNDGKWTLMYDDGTNGDRVANDGNFSIELSLRSSTPLGTHEILLQASDQYDMVTSLIPMTITVGEQSSSIPVIDDVSLSTGLIMGVFSILIIAIIALSAILIKNKNNDDSGEDRFGFQ